VMLYGLSFDWPSEDTFLDIFRNSSHYPTISYRQPDALRDLTSLNQSASVIDAELIMLKFFSKSL
jgi:hypothetical protein